MKKLIGFLMMVMMLVLGQTNLVFAGSPAKRISLPDSSFLVTNPCNGREVIVTWTDLTLLIRTGQDANDGNHNIFKIQGSMFDTSGFSGKVLLNSHHNASDPDNFQVNEVVRIVARNPETHQTIILRENFHLNVRDGVVTLEIERFDEKCVGNSK